MLQVLHAWPGFVKEMRDAAPLPYGRMTYTGSKGRTLSSQQPFA